MKKYVLGLCFTLLLFGSSRLGGAQDDNASRIYVSVVLVQLNVAVTDDKGNYVTGLRPEDFQIIEDKIPEKVATFEEGNGPPIHLLDPSGKPTLEATSVSAASGPARALARSAGVVGHGAAGVGLALRRLQGRDRDRQAAAARGTP